MGELPMYVGQDHDTNAELLPRVTLLRSISGNGLSVRHKMFTQASLMDPLFKNPLITCGHYKDFIIKYHTQSILQNSSKYTIQCGKMS